MSGHSEPQDQLPPQAQIFAMINQMWTTRATAAIAKLGVPDVLAAGPKSAREIAQMLQLNEAALFRLLRAGSVFGILRHDTAANTFELTDLGHVLRSDSPNSLRNYLLTAVSPSHWRPWGQVEQAVQTGLPPTLSELGCDIFTYFQRNPKEAEDFANAMSHLSSLSIEPTLDVLPLDKSEVVVDVGGSHGVLLGSILGRWKHLRGVLLEVPEVIQTAPAVLEPFGLGDRIELVAGDFFKDIPAGDTYILKHILHDWSDDECIQILSNVYKAMAPGGRIFVLEILVDTSSKASATNSVCMDLNMLVLTTGRERTLEEYGCLFSKTGLHLRQAHKTASLITVIEGYKD
ncbi:O-methyltransferase family protein [Polychytrium aggregatum]|uniref:O-methyltransferase family protein n=1 Tax=Polychytrium aggregatum TaxID=110093 RepID=UPI0022FDE767|nr:O-methyltransferase family protein [Polychytrium aggregatum]KAI9205721.1 O-methyltransferase family protein [Polychytrium aggregatum]